MAGTNQVRYKGEFGNDEDENKLMEETNTKTVKRAGIRTKTACNKNCDL